MYRAMERTLSNEEVNVLAAEVRRRAQEQLKLVLR
jgi:phenylalanyl-tRNA synthetase beta subunit